MKQAIFLIISVCLFTMMATSCSRPTKEQDETSSSTISGEFIESSPKEETTDESIEESNSGPTDSDEQSSKDEPTDSDEQSTKDESTGSEGQSSEETIESSTDESSDTDSDGWQDENVDVGGWT